MDNHMIHIPSSLEGGHWNIAQWQSDRRDRPVSMYVCKNQIPVCAALVRFQLIPNLALSSNWSVTSALQAGNPGSSPGKATMAAMPKNIWNIVIQILFKS